MGRSVKICKKTFELKIFKRCNKVETFLCSFDLLNIDFLVYYTGTDDED